MAEAEVRMRPGILKKSDPELSAGPAITGDPAVKDEPALTGASEQPESSQRRAATAVGGWRDIARSGGVKFIAMGVSAVLGIIITRIIIQNYGIDAYAQYGLLVGLGALIPVGALGVDAPIMNTVAASESPASDLHLRRVLVTTLRVLVAAAAILLVIVVVMSVFSLWAPLLGESLLPGTGAIAAAVCVVLWAIAMPFGIGQRVLAGLGKNHVTIAISGLQSPVVLLVLLFSLWIGTDAGSFVPVVSYAATLMIAIIAAVIASRLIRPNLWQAIKETPFVRRFPGGKILDQAWPMTVIMIALPLSMQTDRLILSHAAGSAELAQYNLAAQMYFPIGALVSAAGFTLWPRFAAARARGHDESPLRLTIVFGAIAAGMCLAVSLISGWLAAFASGGEVSLSLLLILSFSAWMIIQGFQYPMGMYLTDKKGLRFQALMVTLMVPVTLGLSWVLAVQLGAPGPVIGSALGVLFFQVLANVIYVRRRARRTRGVTV